MKLVLLLAACFCGLGAAAGTAIVEWHEPENTAGIAGYRVYQIHGFQTNSITVPAGRTSTTISNLVAGTVYHFVVRAFDQWNIESVPSNEVEFVPVETSEDDGVLVVSVTLIPKSTAPVSTWKFEQRPPISFVVTNRDLKKYTGSRVEILKKQ